MCQTIVNGPCSWSSITAHLTAISILISYWMAVTWCALCNAGTFPWNNSCRSSFTFSGRFQGNERDGTRNPQHNILGLGLLGILIVPSLISFFLNPPPVIYSGGFLRPEAEEKERYEGSSIYFFDLEIKENGGTFSGPRTTNQTDRERLLVFVRGSRFVVSRSRLGPEGNWRGIKD